jgi:hypothetical protein
MSRWRDRLWLDPILHGGHAVDSLYAFTQTCYHLVDCLENDRSQRVRREQAEAYVAAVPLLAFCREICNGSKHARIEEKKVQIETKRTPDPFRVEDDSGQMREIMFERTELSVYWDGQFLDIETFGRRCVEAWDVFLRREGLLTRSEPPADAEGKVTGETPGP